MDIVIAEKISMRFGSLAAVDQADIRIRQGEIFGLVGPDGAGKTTITRLLASVLTPTSGNAWVAGYHIVNDSEALKQEIGYMSQRFGLYADLTVEENLQFFADIYCLKRKDAKEKISQLLNFSNLHTFRRRLAGNLSGGMKQKLALACAIVHSPKVLFLDEPTGGVDPLSRRDFWDILKQLLREKVTILLTTSYMEEAERCSQVAFINKGRILASGAPTEMKKLMTGAIVEIRTENPKEANSILEKYFSEQDLHLFGTKIHIVTKAPEETMHLVKNLLSDFQDLQISKAEFSLEDAFISLLSERENAIA